MPSCLPLSFRDSRSCSIARSHLPNHTHHYLRVDVYSAVQAYLAGSISLLLPLRHLISPRRRTTTAAAATTTTQLSCDNTPTDIPLLLKTSAGPLYTSSADTPSPALTSIMKRNVPIAHLLYNHLFPNPEATPNCPPSFSAHLARNLVPEVRIEVATFYGDLNSAEARYPGLNYCYPPHRMRLGRFKHHRRLFDAFDALGLTYNEIQDFCCWEGTKWARERYEKDEGVKVLDTTGDEIGPYVDRRERDAEEELRRHSITRKTDISVIVEEATSNSVRQPAISEDDEEMNDAESDGEADAETETEQESPSEAAARQQHIAELEQRRDHSITQRINQQILHAWEHGQSLPPEIEQYLKEQSERGNTEYTQLLSNRRSSQRYTPPENNALVATQAPRAAA